MRKKLNFRSAVFDDVRRTSGGRLVAIGGSPVWRGFPLYTPWAVGGDGVLSAAGGLPLYTVYGLV